MCHWHRRVLSLFRVSIRPAVHSSVHPERCYHSDSKNFRYQGWCKIPWSRLIYIYKNVYIYTQNSHVQQSFLCSMVFKIFDDRLGPSVKEDITALTLQMFQLSAWNLVQWCIIPWSRLLFKMVMLDQFLHIPWNFEIFHYGLVPCMRGKFTTLIL